MPIYAHPFRTPKTLRAFTRSSKGGRFFYTQFTPNSYAILTRVYFAYDFICSFASSVLRNGVGENRPTLHRLHKWVLHRLTHIR